MYIFSGESSMYVNMGQCLHDISALNPFFFMATPTPARVALSFS
jgi:hypothetical protein